MPLLVQCPNPSCAKKSRLADEALGRQVLCPHCGMRFAAATHGPDASSVGDHQPRSPASDAPPVRVARFEVRALLGEGAFGRVFRAHDPQLDREVALKVPHPSTLASPRAVERFLREARAASRLRHPHIVPIHDAGRDGQHLYIASAFIEGTTLERAIDDKSLDDMAAARIVRELAEALAYAHEQGIVHRDVKPANVLLDGAGHAHLADFGLAHRQDSADKLTHDGAVIGTPAYMAPEQARGRKDKVLPASDQYALGVVLYELLTGRVPFSGPVALVLSMQVNQEPPAPHTIRSEVPRDLETICVKALSKRPQDRYASCQELADDLRRWLDGEPIKARPLSTWEWLVRWCRRNPTQASACGVAAAALLLAFVLAISFAFSQQSHNRKLQVERDAAEAARNELDEKNKDLVESEGRKEAALEAEKRAAEQARQEKEVAEGLVYVAHMHLSYRAWEDADMGQLVALLDGQRPQATGGRDRRGWEWHFLHRLSRPKCLILKGQTWDNWFGNMLAFSSDGKRLATSSNDATARVWDVQTGQELLILRGLTNSLDAVAFSPDGKRLATAYTGVAQVRDAQTGQVLFTLKGHKMNIMAVAFSPDGKRLATTSFDKTARVWDAQTGQELLTLKGHTGFVHGVVFSADGKRLATASTDKTSRVWDTQTGQELLTLKLHTSEVNAVAFSPDGKRLATTSLDKTARVWDAQTGQDLLTLKGHTDFVNRVAFSSDGERLATTSRDKTVRVWDVQTGQELLTLKGHTSEVRGVVFSPDGKRLATNSVDETTRVWDAQTGQEPLTLKGHTNAVFGVVFSPDGKHLITTSRDNSTRVWDAQTGQELSTLKGYSGDVLGVVLSPDGKRLATASGDKTVRVWDVQKGQELLTLRGHTQQVHFFAFSPDGRRLATASGDKTARVWNTQTGQELFTLKILTGAVVFSPDNKRLATASGDHIVRVWDAQTGQEILTLKGDGALVFSPDGKRLATASVDHTVRMWDAETGQELLTFRGHTNYVVVVAFSPDGKRLATASGDKTARVWATQTGQELLTLTGHTDAVFGVAFSPDGNRLATASLDKTLRIWDGTPLPEEATPSEQPR